MRNIQRKTALLLCTVLSLGALWGCGKKDEVETVDDVAVVETASPEIGELVLTGSFIATVSPDESVYVLPKTTAEVLAVNVKAGDAVEEGQVLAELDDTIAKINYSSAQIGVKTAQIGVRKAQIGMQAAEIQLDNAQRAYNMQYGEGAQTLVDMKSDSDISSVEDGVEQLQDNMLDAMDNLDKAKKKLAEKERELADLRAEYGFSKDVDEILDYAKSFDKNTREGAADYAAAMQRYELAKAEVSPVEMAIKGGPGVTGLKPTIDQLEEGIEQLQDQIDSTYESYSQLVTSTAIQNGEIREEQRQTGQNTISSAQAGVENAQKDFENAQNGVANAQNAMKQAQENLDTYTVKATISGVVETVNIKEHDFAAPSSPAFVISNKDTMVATYYVSEDVRNTFSEGQKIALEKDDRTYGGEVIEIGGAVDAQTGLFKIKAAVRGNTDGLLTGTKATVTTDTYHEKGAVIIPYRAVYYDGTQAYVYTVVDNRAKKTNITTGLYDIDNIVVMDGLAASDVVVTTWSAQLRDGVEISVKESAKKDSGK